MRYTAVLVLALACAACSSSNTQLTSAVTSMNSGHAGITRIGMRRQTVIVQAGMEGPIYSIQSRDGRTLVADTTLEELAAKDPKAARSIRRLRDGLTWAGL